MKTRLSFPLTREGAIWLVAALALLATGLLKGINLITLLACLMLSLLAFNLVLAKRQLRGLQGRRFLLDPIFAHTPFEVLVELENARRGKRLGVKLCDPGQDHEARWFVPRIQSKETLKFQKPMLLQRRGMYLWGPLRVETGYPLGLVRRIRILAPRQDVIVLPALGQLQKGVLRRFLTQSSPTLGQALGHPRRHRAAQTEVHGVRPFQMGDSTRWIHWRTSARRGELMVREFEEMPSDNLTLIVEPWRPSPQSKSSNLDEGLELALSLAATICWEWCRQKGDRLLLGIAGPEPLVLSGVTSQNLAMEMLEGLAVQTGCQAVDLGLLLERLREHEIPPGPIFLLTTHAGDLEDALARSLHHPIACANIADGSYQEFFGKRA